MLNEAALSDDETVNELLQAIAGPPRKHVLELISLLKVMRTCEANELTSFVLDLHTYSLTVGEVGLFLKTSQGPPARQLHEVSAVIKACNGDEGHGSAGSAVCSTTDLAKLVHLMRHHSLTVVELQKMLNKCGSLD